MMRRSRKLIAPALALAILPLAGCETPIPPSSAILDRVLQPIRNSPQAPCAMQREVAEHNSVVDTLKKGKDITYKAPCDIEAKPVPKVS